MFSRLSNRCRKNKGFTLIELMITIGIFVFMTALLLAKYNSFYSGTIFKNLAYDIALTIRQAQTYGISVKVNEGDNKFDTAYGVEFSRNGTAATKKFTLNSYSYNQVFGTYTVSTKINDYNLKYGSTINQLCILDSTGACNAGTGAIILAGTDLLRIIFKRPNPEAIICRVTNAGVQTCDHRSVRVQVRASNSTTRDIEINNAGQIVVK